MIYDLNLGRDWTIPVECAVLDDRHADTQAKLDAIQVALTRLDQIADQIANLTAALNQLRVNAASTRAEVTQERTSMRADLRADVVADIAGDIEKAADARVTSLSAEITAAIQADVAKQIAGVRDAHEALEAQVEALARAVEALKPKGDPAVIEPSVP